MSKVSVRCDQMCTWFYNFLAPSIPTVRMPPPNPPGNLQVCPPQGGAFAGTVQPGGEALSKAILSFRF